MPALVFVVVVVVAAAAVGILIGRIVVVDDSVAAVEVELVQGGEQNAHPPESTSPDSELASHHFGSMMMNRSQ